MPTCWSERPSSEELRQQIGAAACDCDEGSNRHMSNHDYDLCCPVGCESTCEISRGRTVECCHGNILWGQCALVSRGWCVCHRLWLVGVERERGTTQSCVRGREHTLERTERERERETEGDETGPGSPFGQAIMTQLTHLFQFTSLPLPLLPLSLHPPHTHSSRTPITSDTGEDCGQ